VIEVCAVLCELDVDFDVDVIVIICGGGLFEDFLLFSNEMFVCVVVVVVIFVVSVIGYEVDMFLFDLVVDVCVLMFMDVVKFVVFDVVE